MRGTTATFRVRKCERNGEKFSNTNLREWEKLRKRSLWKSVNSEQQKSEEQKKTIKENFERKKSYGRKDESVGLFGRL